MEGMSVKQTHAEGTRERQAVTFPGPTAAALALPVLVAMGGTGAKQHGKSHVPVYLPKLGRGSCEFGVLPTWSGAGVPVTLLHEPSATEEQLALSLFPTRHKHPRLQRPVARPPHPPAGEKYAALYHALLY